MNKSPKLLTSNWTLRPCELFRYCRIVNWTLVALLLVLIISSVTWATDSLNYNNKPKFKEAYRLKIWNLPGGTIEVSQDEGKNWESLGSVVLPTNKVNVEGYTASRWVPDGKVAATAVNAIHIKTSHEAATGVGVVFSLLPNEFLQSQKNYRSYLSHDASIYTDIPAGESIFGNNYAPYVGNIVMVSRPGAEVIPLPKGFVPRLGDKIYIMVDKPIEYPQEITFENRQGGEVWIKYSNGTNKVIGRVVRPVSGIGRFEGTKYAAVGRIRANHAGVIDVSTSPLKAIGGFQIVPSKHGTNIATGLRATQWLVVGPANSDDFDLEGRWPLFSYFIKPNYSKDDLVSDDWYNKLLARFLVDIKQKGSDKWQPMPVHEIDDYNLIGELPAWAGTALSNVTDLRILFPLIVQE